jgi:hypothetical protein
LKKTEEGAFGFGRRGGGTSFSFSKALVLFESRHFAFFLTHRGHDFDAFLAMSGRKRREDALNAEESAGGTSMMK